VNHVGEARSTQQAPTVVVSERAEPNLRAENTVGFSNGTVSIQSEQYNKSNSSCTGNSISYDAEALCQNTRTTICSRSSCETDSGRKPPLHYMKRQQKKLNESMPAAQVMIESQYETGHTSEDTGNELEWDQKDYLYRLYPAITTDEQRRRYKKEFDSDLAHYKSLCSEMDDISDQMHKLSRELDTLDESSMKYQGVADEYNGLKDLKKTDDYQTKRRQSKELRRKLFHIKHLVKIYDQGFC
ncbi:hypothetical protein AMECASPLE_028530, partial [Ameca splendens]